MSLSFIIFTDSRAHKTSKPCNQPLRKMLFVSFILIKKFHIAYQSAK